MTENNKCIFQVGQTYKTHGGKEAKILLHLTREYCPLLVANVDDSDYWTATPDGHVLSEGGIHENDLLPPEKPTCPFEVGKVYKSNNGIYYRIESIKENGSATYPIGAAGIGDDDDEDFDSEYYEEFTLDGIFLIGSHNNDDDLIPTPVKWSPPVKKPAITPFEVGKYYRDREGYYFQVVAVDRPTKDYPVNAKSVGGPGGESIVHVWSSYYTLDGIYDEANPGTNEDLLPTPVEWPVPQATPPVPQATPPEKTPDRNPPKVQPLPDSCYLLVDARWYGTPEMREDEMSEGPEDPKEIRIRRVAPLPNNVFLVEVAKKYTSGKEYFEWKHWDDTTGGMVPLLLPQPRLG